MFFPARLGRRGLALAICGVVWVLMGWSLWTTAEPQPPASRWLLHESIPLSLRAACWIISGVLAVVTAWWPPGADRWGFTLLVVMPLQRSASYVGSYLLYLSPSDHGYARAWLGAAIWGGFAALIMVMAGWKEIPAAGRIPFPPDAKHAPESGP